MARWLRLSYATDAVFAGQLAGMGAHVARIFPLFLILSLILPAATPWAQTLTQDDYKLLGIKPPPPGFVDVVGVPDVQKMPTGAFPEGMTVVDAGLGDPGGLMIVTLRVPAERADEARKLMLDWAVVNALIDKARKRSIP